MEQLINTIQEIENTYKSKAEYLKGLKRATFFSAFSAIGYATFKVFTAKGMHRIKLETVLTAEIAVLLLVLIPIVLAPLYMFFSDKVQTRFSWDIKNSIFKTVLSKYNLDYNISLRSQLSDSDIKNLQFENSLLTFAYGDDLILGYAYDGTKFRIAEMHSTSFFKRKFDGIVGVLIFYDDLLCKATHKRLESNKSSIKVVNIDNKIYFLKPGAEQHFEFKFKGFELNQEQLIVDYNYFDELVCLMFEK